MSPILQTPFERLYNEAQQQVLNSPWPPFDRTSSWRDVLPCPDLSAVTPKLPRFSYNLVGIILPTKQELELRWALNATNFYVRTIQSLSFKQSTMERCLDDKVRAWNSSHPERAMQLAVTNVYHQWKDSVGQLSLNEFIRLNIGAHTARQFLAPKFRVIEELYGIYERKGVSEKQKKPLTVFIIHNARLPLFEALKTYIDEINWPKLQDLLAGQEESLIPIPVHCLQNTLGRIFYDAYTDKENACTKATKKAFADWICMHFVKDTEQGLVRLTKSTMLNHLKNVGFNKE